MTPRARLYVLAAAAALHLLFVVSPLDVLAPVDAHDIGRRMLHGDLPYRDFGFEYPPLAVLAFLLPGLVPGSLAPSVLALQAVAAEVLIVWVVLRRHPGAVERYAAASLFVFPFLSGGFDAFPMAALAVSTSLLVATDPAGWWVAGAGTLVKLSPAAAWSWARTAPRIAVVSLAVTALVALAPVAAAGPSTDSYVGWSIERGVQMESVAASTTWAAHELAGSANRFDYRFRSWELAGASAAAVAWGVLALGGLAAIAWAAHRRGVDGWRAALAAVLLLLVGSKVLSPQFLAWGAPLAAVVGGPLYAGYVGVCALTLLMFGLDAGPTSFVGLVAARNLALVALTGFALREALHARPDVVDLAAE